MRMAILITAALEAAVSQPAAAQGAAPPQPQAEKPKIDDAPARRLLEVVSSVDKARAKVFFGEALTPDPRFGPPEAMLTRLLALTRHSGGVEVTEWHPDGGMIFFDGRTMRGGIPVQGMVSLKDGRIAGFEMERNPTARGEGAPAWPPAARAPAEAVEAIAREIDWRAEQGRFPGAVLIAQRGKPVLERAWGLARRGPEVPATPRTLFTTASASKMLTAAAIGRLIDQGKLGFDTTLARAVPAFASAPEAESVTIRDLLGHCGSYGDHWDEMRAARTSPATSVSASSCR